MITLVKIKEYLILRSGNTDIIAPNAKIFHNFGCPQPLRQMFDFASLHFTFYDSDKKTELNPFLMT